MHCCVLFFVGPPTIPPSMYEQELAGMLHASNATANGFGYSNNSGNGGYTSGGGYLSSTDAIPVAMPIAHGTLVHEVGVANSCLSLCMSGALVVCA